MYSTNFSYIICFIKYVSRDNIIYTSIYYMSDRYLLYLDIEYYTDYRTDS